ncbi:MAG: hypothetical protein QM486_12110 [Flavobacteriaceae bacterium]
MKIRILLLLVILASSCTKKALKLPKSHTKASTEVLNNSNIWIFYTLKGQDTVATLNRNNSISTTNWLYNIDRRLQLKHLYKPLKKILAKRQKKSPHHVEGMKNYFSFADTLDKHNKFLEFKLKDILYKKPLLNDTTHVVFQFYKTQFKLNDASFNYAQFDSVIKLKKMAFKEGVQFYYKDNLSYDTYLNIKISLHNYPFLKGLENTTDFYFK